jgi:hypothetical protein
MSSHGLKLIVWALRRHEIAFVFGQLLSIHSVPALLQVLGDDNQSDMVRHEAAEALGGIGAPDLKPILEEWAKRQDAPQVIRESCEVALDMWEVGITRLRGERPQLMMSSQSMRTQVLSSTPMGSKTLAPQPSSPLRHDRAWWLIVILLGLACLSLECNLAGCLSLRMYPCGSLAVTHHPSDSETALGPHNRQKMCGALDLV